MIHDTRYNKMFSYSTINKIYSSSLKPLSLLPIVFFFLRLSNIVFLFLYTDPDKVYYASRTVIKKTYVFTYGYITSRHIALFKHEWANTIPTGNNYYLLHCIQINIIYVYCLIYGEISNNKQV